MFVKNGGTYYNLDLAICFYLVKVNNIFNDGGHWKVQAEMVNGETVDLYRFDTKEEAERKIEELGGGKIC